MKLAVVGATGMVGQIMIRVLEERKFPCRELLLAASEKSIGKTVWFNGQQHVVQSIEEVLSAKPDVAIFSAGGSVSKQWAPIFAEAGIVVIDNSSAWRMYEEVPLVVPEINANAIKPEHYIIANPNCSTIQMVLALSELHKLLSIDRIVVSTYQSVTGTGVKAKQQLMDERSGKQHVDTVYPHPIDLNCLPHGGDFDNDGYTTEELKLVHETRKILSSPEIKVTATVVRVPVLGGHSESVNVSFRRSFTMDEIIETLSKTKGVVVQDDPLNNVYPMPIYCENKDGVFIGRIRRDFSHPNTINAWIVSDNLRKGAATNAIQIAEYLLSGK